MSGISQTTFTHTLQTAFAPLISKRHSGMCNLGRTDEHRGPHAAVSHQPPCCAAGFLYLFVQFQEKEVEKEVQ